RLQIEGISQASAEQRKGRCGRVREGICVRLYDEQSFASRPAFTDPEIKRTGLAGVILRMKALGLGEVEDYPFLDPPQPRAIAEGYRVLEELGALGPGRELTPIGERLARFPVDPRIGRMILAGAELGCLREVLVVAAALNVQDPRDRPRDLQQKADEQHRRFRDERSDFVGLVRLWEFVKEAERKGKSNLRRVCKEGFLSFVRIREWGEIHRQLEEAARELPQKGEKVGSAQDNALHRALVTGLLSKIGMWNPEHRIYIGAKQTRFAIHPSSSLARKPPAWIMAFELVETTQLFARTVAKVEPEWLLEAAPHLLKRSYSEPHWSEKSARASVREHATLFGLSISRDRSVDYATVAPAQARRMFLEHALVRGEYKTAGAFQRKNAELLAEVARLRDKARKSDMLANDDALLAFFDQRVGDEVVNGKTFEAWRERAEEDDPRTLVLSLEDVLVDEQNLLPADYPDAISLHGATLPVSYRFDPSAEDDGITLTVPLVLLPQLDPGELDWTIPGWHREKIAVLLYELPRGIRRELGEAPSPPSPALPRGGGGRGGNIPELAHTLASALTPFDGPMIPALARAISDAMGVDVPEESFRPDMVATYLRLTCRVVGDDGKVVAQSREIDDLLKQYGARARAIWKKTAPPSAWERKGITAWDFGELPPFVVRRVSGTEVRSYPALVDRGTSVELVLLESAGAADAASRAGGRRLLVLASRGAVSAIEPRIPRAFSRPNGVLVSRAENEAFRDMVLMRIVDVAFGLEEDTGLPRDKRAFDQVVAA
ncbi:MAG TPA: ATP-dependent RNA helicase HrpA, partial [Polyangiaceae bacterium]|nr:ATP-dependent RNA helicase HrpA [Polyangiaceae bacterium]